MHVRKNDTVLITIGDDAGKRGKVLRAFPTDSRVVVEGANFVFKHLRKSSQYPQGGRVRREAPMNVTNVKLVCPHCNKPNRPKKKQQENGKWLRACRACGELIAAVK